MIPRIDADDPFPPLTSALADPNGLLAASRDLSADMVERAYRQGIFPWFSEGQPVLWWSPNPRMVLFVREFHAPANLAKSLRRFARGVDREVRLNTAFEAVMRACSAPRPGQEGTWITEAMVAAYLELHRRGIAHSVETWIGGALAGGLYGLAIGRMFYGESMFTRAAGASKIALAHLVGLLARNGFELIDCQQETRHLASLGARPIARSEFARRLVELTAQAGIDDWSPARLTLTGERRPLDGTIA